MSSNPPGFGLPSPDVAAFELNGSALVIYDTTNEDAWIQSDAPVTLP
jgi:hypothetical protein